MSSHPLAFEPNSLHPHVRYIDLACGHEGTVSTGAHMPRRTSLWYCPRCGVLRPVSDDAIPRMSWSCDWPGCQAGGWVQTDEECDEQYHAHRNRAHR